MMEDRASVNPLLCLLLGVIAAVLQSSWVSRVSILGGVPNVILMAVCVWVWFGRSEDGLLFGLSAGFICDALSAAPFGACMTAFASAALLAGIIDHNVSDGFTAAFFGIVGFATVLYEIIIVIWLWAGGHTVLWGDLILNYIIPSVIINTLGAGLFYLIGTFITLRKQAQKPGIL